MTKTNKAFTLIELLVVIAIIGILAGILFVAINPKKQSDKAKAANIKSQLAQVPTQAALQDSTSFDDVCTDGKNTLNLIKSAASTATGKAVADLVAGTDYNCVDGTNGFAADVTFNNNGTNETYCVDASGVSKGKTANSTNLDCE